MSLTIHTLKLDLGMKLMTELSKIDRFDATWTSIEKREGATLKQLKSIATVRSVGASTRIEGSKMTDDEVAVLIDKLSVSKLEERDQQEVIGYFEALDTITENYKSIGISESQIKNLHKILMQYGEKDAWHRGNYKQVSNAVEANLIDGTKQVVFRTAEPGIATQDAMMMLFEWYNSDTETIPLVKAALFVYEFLSIHPFQDGNGRLSRLLGSLLLLKTGYSWIQYVSFEHEIENRKTEYYKVLMQTQRNRPGENVTDWLRFFISCLINIQEQLMIKLEENKTEKPILQRDKRILFFIQNHAGCSSGEISKKLDLALPTVKKSLGDLVSKGIITKEGQGKSTGYFAVV
jgi:Fic family protein